MPELSYPKALPADKSEECRLSTLTQETAALRQHRVADLCSQVTAGTYCVPAEPIAEKMLVRLAQGRKEHSRVQEG